MRQQARAAAATALPPAVRAQRPDRRAVRSDARRALRALVVAIVFCAALTAINLGGVNPLISAGEVASVDDRRWGQWADLQATVFEVESYRAEHGALPASLAELGYEPADDAWRYEVVSAEHFRLTLTADGVPWTYDSAVDRSPEPVAAQRAATR